MKTVGWPDRKVPSSSNHKYLDEMIMHMVEYKKTHNEPVVVHCRLVSSL